MLCSLIRYELETYFPEADLRRCTDNQRESISVLVGNRCAEQIPRRSRAKTDMAMDLIPACPSTSRRQGSLTLNTGGERGIRTPDTRKGIHAFEARAFSHSAISPRSRVSFILSGKLSAPNLSAQVTERSPAQPPHPSP